MTDQRCQEHYWDSDHQSIGGDLSPSPEPEPMALMWPELPGVTIGVLSPGHRRLAATCQRSRDLH